LTALGEHSLCKCIRAVYAGQIWANSTQLDLIVEALVNRTPIQITKVKGRQLLAQREEEVANLVADGLSKRDIARKLPDWFSSWIRLNLMGAT
jgi:DNA-binding NarL/FixJ family response regulator